MATIDAGSRFDTLESNLQVTNRVLGRGSYTTVLELEYMLGGLKCAGKQIHDSVLPQEATRSDIACRFEKECQLLGKIHHPNIVQFLGLYYGQDLKAPMLIMESLATNLTSCIKQYGILPDEISYSILHDVALALDFIHNLSPPYIHRDLTSNNILLTPNMTAKISDLGVATILNLTPPQVRCMTPPPGTLIFMPPEVMVANPKYNTSVDEFSYGILMIHMFSGQWPKPHDSLQIRVSEAERRKVFLQAIGNHPLMDLIHKCIDNTPEKRPHANEIVKLLAKKLTQNPPSFANQIEAIKQIEKLKRQLQMCEEHLYLTRQEVQRVKENIAKITEII